MYYENDFSKMGVFSLDLVREEPQESQEWLWRGVIPAGNGVHIFGAHGAVGKTTFILQLCSKILSGYKQPVLLSHDVASKPDAKIAYVSTEATAAAIAKRVQSLGIKLSFDNFHVYSMDSGYVTSADVRNSLQLLMETHDFVVIDTAVQLLSKLGLSNNDYNDITNVLVLPIREIQRSLRKPCPILMVHHLNKNNNSFMGSAAWNSAFDTRIQVDTPKDREETLDDGSIVRHGSFKVWGKGVPETRFFAKFEGKTGWQDETDDSINKSAVSLVGAMLGTYLSKVGRWEDDNYDSFTESLGKIAYDSNLSIKLGMTAKGLANWLNTTDELASLGFGFKRLGRRGKHRRIMYQFFRVEEDDGFDKIEKPQVDEGNDSNIESTKTKPQNGVSRPMGLMFEEVVEEVETDPDSGSESRFKAGFDEGFTVPLFEDEMPGQGGESVDEATPLEAYADLFV